LESIKILLFAYRNHQKYVSIDLANFKKSLRPARHRARLALLARRARRNDGLSKQIFDNRFWAL
jgi:hypothetical protein